MEKDKSKFAKSDQNNQELVKDTLKNLLETDDRDKQKSTIKKLPVEQLDLLDKVTNKELNNEIKKSNAKFEKESAAALDDVEGYAQFYSGPTKRSVSKQEESLGSISKDIKEEVRERYKTKIKQQEGQQVSGQSSKETSDIRESQENEPAVFFDQSGYLDHSGFFDKNGKLNEELDYQQDYQNQASARLGAAATLKEKKSLKTEDPSKYQKALSKSIKGLAKQHESKRSKPPNLEAISEGAEPSISSSTINVSSQKDERKPDPPGKHVENLLASRQNKQLEI